ncbi:ATP-dependent Clp protease proteolytic subunit [Chamaesiphon sp. VAR_48_metabat_403]|uniref:ATP-dependent Clp protease proteolytic subunit n=1 Tax=Chamaesiphon sp. VAR_48_metabat_403 TaxID=2964700 RepID=UPI00286E1942|nr:ATP-dependent Clp protease proteolytic subunit [Chamaesiphon sp. VAR_48_metabat_403]
MQQNNRSNEEARILDLYSQLLHKRIVLLNGEIDDNIANTIVAQLLYLESEDPDRDICLYINSPGGSVTAGMAIFDTMAHICPDVSTVCVGLVAGMGSFLLAAGTKGKRCSIPNTRIAIVPMSVGVNHENDIDLEIQAREMMEIKNIIDNLWVQNTGQTLQKIQADTERDFYMSPVDAIEYGLIDRLVDRPELAIS